MKADKICCGVKFCGGCNPKYDRGAVFAQFKTAFEDRICFDIAQEGTTYDLLLIIGGCSSCCASYDQYENHGSVLKIWDTAHVKDQLQEMKRITALKCEQRH